MVQVAANLAVVIKDIDAEMREAATNLGFEHVIRLRDEIKRLRTMKLGTLD